MTRRASMRGRSPLIENRSHPFRRGGTSPGTTRAWAPTTTTLAAASMVHTGPPTTVPILRKTYTAHPAIRGRWQGNFLGLSVVIGALERGTARLPHGYGMATGSH